MSKEASSDIGLIGLAVMGQNLVLNMADHGYHVSVYNRTTTRMTAFVDRVQNEEPCSERVHGYESLEEFVASIKRPRKVILLVKTGRGTDAAIDSLLPHMEEGDIVIDGGNAHWMDTIRREKDIRARGLHFMGSGVSGGELGARFGPALMPGGSDEAWTSLQPIWEAIAAKVDPDTGKPYEDYAAGKPITEGTPCTAYLGPDGAGHYVKMVHNGIEYVDMQLICESYFLMKELLSMQPDEIAAVFHDWNQGVLDSYLIEITADILAQRDPRDASRFLVDQVLDTAGQKGTGKWTSISTLDLGIPANAMAEAVFARFLSALKVERVAASQVLKGPGVEFSGDQQEFIDLIRQALYSSKICAYAQGFSLMTEAQQEFNWQLDFGTIAKVWRGGCIIRARFLQKITDAYDNDPELANLMLDPYFRDALHDGQSAWRKVVAAAAESGIAVPAFMSALAYFDGYRSAVLPANLLQAQRDYFGAHTYERTDEERGRFFHVDWPVDGRPEIEV
ncbi:MAG: NADP-dependent phosphogluconate dehydrogenase [Proteobacteria bacterium]|nr:NADP-dependent phosphogluconate dehydrogenase [Pseudomonadota bacterium]